MSQSDLNFATGQRQFFDLEIKDNTVDAWVTAAAVSPIAMVEFFEHMKGHFEKQAKQHINIFFIG